MFDPRENPNYNGPELVGLSDDERFDLAKQLRVAERNKRIAMKLGNARVRRERRLVSFWAVALGIALIAGGLALAMEML